jgi:hypothetical protein
VVVLRQLQRGRAMDETEDEIIKRVGRAMFGDSVAFTPQVMELIRSLYRKYLDDMEAAA